MTDTKKEKESDYIPTYEISANDRHGAETIKYLATLHAIELGSESAIVESLNALAKEMEDWWQEKHGDAMHEDHAEDTLHDLNRSDLKNEELFRLGDSLSVSVERDPITRIPVHNTEEDGGIAAKSTDSTNGRDQGGEDE